MNETDEMYKELNERKREYLNFELQRIIKELAEMGGHYDEQYEAQWRAAMSGECSSKYERMNNNVPLGNTSDLKMEYKQLDDGRLYRIEDVTIPMQMYDFVEVLQRSAEVGKYPANNWLTEDGYGCDHKSQYASIFRHVSSACSGDKIDKDSGLDHRLHAAVRLMMDYVRDLRGFVHPKDND